MLLLNKTYAQFNGGSPFNTAVQVTNGSVGIGTVTPTSPLHVYYAGTHRQVLKVSDNARYIGIGRDEVAAFELNGTPAHMYLGGNTNNYTKLTILSTGEVGVGTTTPGTKLEVAGQVKITGGTPGAGKVLTSDAVGLASWTTMTGLLSGGTTNYIPKWTSANTLSSVSQIYDNGNNVGIATSNPVERLQIGDRIVFHDGGNKYLGYNMAYNGANNVTIVPNCQSSAITFGNGDFTFYTAPLTANANTIVNGTAKMVIKNDGKVRIGTLSPTAPHTDALLAVDGKVACKSLYVLKTTSWADFVFKRNELEKLEDVEKFINKNKHLPGIPSEEEVLTNGYDVNEMDAKLLEKIETLYLHIISLEKEIKDLKNK